MVTSNDDDLGLDTVANVDEDIGLEKVADIKDMPESNVSKFKRGFSDAMSKVGEAAGVIAGKTAHAVNERVVSGAKSTWENLKKAPKQAEEFVEEVDEYAKEGGKKARKFGKFAKRVGSASRKIVRISKKGYEVALRGDRMLKQAVAGPNYGMGPALSMTDFGLGGSSFGGAGQVDFGPSFGGPSVPVRNGKRKVVGERVVRQAPMPSIDFGFSHFGSNRQVSGNGGKGGGLVQAMPDIDFGFSHFSPAPSVSPVRGRKGRVPAPRREPFDILGAQGEMFRRRRD